MPNQTENEPIEVALQRKVEALEGENQLMRRLGTVQGFMQAYFDTLKTTKTHREAFEVVNEQYFRLWGQYRYADYYSFKSVKRNHFKKPNK